MPEIHPPRFHKSSGSAKHLQPALCPEMTVSGVYHRGSCGITAGLMAFRDPRICMEEEAEASRVHSHAEAASIA